MNVTNINPLLQSIRDCTHCANRFVHEPNPIFQASAEAKILIIGQAPGLRTHKSGKPWDDPSGKKLREWMGVTDEEFYDSSKIALLPMSFCFPGSGKSGDLPPITDCSELWHEKLLKHLTNVELTIVIGSYAQKAYMEDRGGNLTETVRDFERYLPSMFPLPHPSPRNRFWLSKNPWFEQQTVQVLGGVVAHILR